MRKVAIYMAGEKEQESERERERLSSTIVCEVGERGVQSRQLLLLLLSSPLLTRTIVYFIFLLLLRLLLLSITSFHCRHIWQFCSMRLSTTTLELVSQSGGQW